MNAIKDGRWPQVRESLVRSSLALAGLVALAVGASAEQPIADILARVRPAVVTVIVDMGEGQEGWQGSGFIVGAEGLVVTNWHVIMGAKSALIKQENGAFFPVEGLLAWDFERDFALLKVAGKGLPTVPLGDSDALRQGDNVLALGSPKGLENTASQGIVSAIRELPGERKLIQTTAAVSEGSSGGPLLDMQGRVVGITSFQVLEGQALNFAIPINEVKEKLKAAGQGVPLGQELGPEPGPAPTPGVGAWGLIWQGRMALPAGPEAPGAEQAFAAALRLFQKAAREDPQLADAHFWVGYCLGELGRYEEEIQAYKQAIRLNPDLALAHCNLGAAYLAQGERGLVLEEYKVLKDLDKDLAAKLFDLLYP